MLSENEGVATFGDAVHDLLSRAECRPAVSIDEREAIYRLRYASYLREGAVAPNASMRIFDRFDDLANTQIFGVYVEGKLASSLRISVANGSSSDIPAAVVFADKLVPMFAAKRTILDPTRFVIDAEHARLYPKLLYVTLRSAWLATEHFDVDDTLASVRKEHQAFYRRFYGHVVLCPARPYLNLIKPLSLMSLDFAPSRSRGLRRYPFLRSTIGEREKLFGIARPSRSPNLDSHEPRAATALATAL